MKLFPSILLLVLASLHLAQDLEPAGVITPIVEGCGPSGSGTVCVNQYAAVLPYHFNRSISNNKQDFDFKNTTVENAPSFDLLGNASFVVFDRERGLQYLGDNPSYEFNLLFISQLAPPVGVVPQLVINLNDDPPTLSNYTPNPPIYAPNGGTFWNGSLLFGASGGADNIGGGEQRVSIRSVDPATNVSMVLLNNYFGFYFNNIDDLAAHPVTGDIFFTDPYYSWFNALTDTAPQLPAASYRFNPTTRATFVIDDTLKSPNGIAFSPDGNTLYISDTGAVFGTIDPALGSQGTTFNTTGPRAIYAWDVENNGTKIVNKRPFYLAQDWVPDGVKVSQEGLVLTGSGHGVDVLDDVGQLLIRIQTNYTVQNFAWTGENLTTLWIMGNNGISKVEWNVQGQTLV